MKKSLSLLLAVAMVFSMFAGLALADTADDLAKLRAAGIIIGGTSGESMDDATWLRENVAVLLSRLYGVAEEAEAAGNTHGFSDVANPYYDGFISWAKEEGIMQGRAGLEAGTFGYGDSVTAQEFATVILRALGIENEDGSDVYGNAIELAVAAGLLPEGTEASAEITRGETYTSIVAALDYEVEEGVTLGASLGLVGWVAEAGDLSAKAVGMKKLEVSVGSAVDTDDITFAVKRGNVTVNVAEVKWNDAGTVATLTTVSNLVSGTHTVTIGGLDVAEGENVVSTEVEASKVTAVNILSDVAPLEDADPATHVTFNYEVLNQYGEDVTSTTNLTWTASSGVVQGGNSSPKQIDGTFTINQTLIVTALHADTAIFATKTLTVGASSKVANITGVALNKDDEIETNSNFGDYYVKVTGIDQYGNKVTTAQLNKDVTVVNSNPSVVDYVKVDNKANFTNDGLQLAKPTPTNSAGSATLTFISNFTGQSDSITINVTAEKKLDSLVLEVPGDLVVQGESTKIPFQAFDQFGNELSEANKAKLDADDLINVTGDNKISLDFSMNYETNLAELTLSAESDATKGNRILMAVTPTGKVSQITVNVLELAKPVAVTGTKDLVQNFTIGGSFEAGAGNFVVIDQHGRTMSNGYLANYDLKVTTSKVDNVSVTGSVYDVIDIADKKVELAGVANGNATISVVVTDNDGTEVADSKYEFTASTIAKSAIASYEVEAPEELYQDSDFDNSGDNNHAKALNVYGKTSSGAKVALNPADINVSTNNTGLNYSAGKLVANDSFGLDNDQTATVSVLVLINGANGPEQVTKSVVVKGETPKLATISAKKDTTLKAEGAVNGTSNFEGEFNFKDQYGVNFAPNITNVTVTNIVKSANSDIAVSGNGSDEVTISDAQAGDSFKVTVLASGIAASTTVVVTE